jgi:hypothetical protein
MRLPPPNLLNGSAEGGKARRKLNFYADDGSESLGQVARLENEGLGATEISEPCEEDLQQIIYAEMGRRWRGLVGAPAEKVQEGGVSPGTVLREMRRLDS